MIFAGLQKLTLLDYPAHTACTIFTKGCNFRCPYCHNYDLLDMNIPSETISKEYILDYLKDKKGKLQGVCLTGGEVLLNNINEIIDFLLIVREMGFLIKIDTNGYFPEKISILLNEKLVDYVAMDIKSGITQYKNVCNVKSEFNIDNIYKSINILINSNIDYEFRTTLVKGMHTKDDMYEIKEMIKGAKKYYLQNYRKVDGMEDLPYKSFLKEEILEFKNIMGDSVDLCELRGIDG